MSEKKARNRKKRISGFSSFLTLWIKPKAEDKGLEPSTGKPAPDFESGC